MVALGVEEQDSRRHHLGSEMLLTLGLFPRSRLERPFDADQSALAQELVTGLGKAPERDDAMPLGLLLRRAGWSAKLVGGQSELRNPNARARAPVLRIS